MGQQTYKRISFESGPLTAEKLNDLVQNMDWLRERMPVGYYFVNNHQKENGLVIQGVVAGLDRSDGTRIKYGDIFWALPFTTGCSPIVTSSMYSTKKATQLFWTLRSINGGIPLDNRGFRIEASMPEDTGLFADSGKQWPGDLKALWSFLAMGY